MKVISEKDMKQVAGAGFSISTSDILDFFRPSSPERTEWVDMNTIESPAYGRGEFFGKLFVSAIAVAGVVVAGLFGKVATK
ncbi:hypothetical protein PMPD1_4344 [Paramixta manurensis]|uniref:Bacteriocin n=1 Tax=Paramixta manurensis TaxID=2740817 RepID=A0A6M8UW03_9GAMM|nr:hypothetical protein PMPD1_4344 [Erwiniaceae bacterium PD-1]